MGTLRPYRAHMGTFTPTARFSRPYGNRMQPKLQNPFPEPYGKYMGKHIGRPEPRFPSMSPIESIERPLEPYGDHMGTIWGAQSHTLFARPYRNHIGTPRATVSFHEPYRDYIGTLRAL